MYSIWASCEASHSYHYYLKFGFVFPLQKLLSNSIAETWSCFFQMCYLKVPLNNLKYGM